MTTSEIISLAASIASLVLAIVAIWLSIVFFRMSSTLSVSANKAAENIASSVQKLEALFDRLYTDTFSMMRDTVSDMRKHIWPDDSLPPDKISEEAEKRANEKVIALKEKLDNEVTGILERQKITDKQLTTVSGQIQELLHNAIQASRQADNEAREETLREKILNSVFNRNTLAGGLLDEFRGKFPASIIIQEIREMERDGLISWKGSLGDETKISPTKKGISWIAINKN